ASAMGLLVSDLKRDYVQTTLGDLDEVQVAEVQDCFAAMEAAALQEMNEEQISAADVRFERKLDLRYSIQKYELPVPAAEGELREIDKTTWRRLFDERHEQHYGSRATDQRVEIVNYHLTARVVLPKPEITELRRQGENPEGALKGRRRAYFDGWVDCPLYDRERLGCGNRLIGPAIVEQPDSTIVIHPGQLVEVDRFGNVIINVRVD
ncbi:MAG TPA: hydantoinase/oxoprolinase family protein, partial [Terriglobia bacterium]|nr:hydantoinase/oxoprolinase family protein [Terriglobia bacterium]